MKTKHYILIAVALLIIAILAIPAWAKKTSHIHAEDGTIINGDASYSDFACAFWKAKLFKKGSVIDNNLMGCHHLQEVLGDIHSNNPTL